MDLVDGVLRVPCLEGRARLLFSDAEPSGDPRRSGAFSVTFDSTEMQARWRVGADGMFDTMPLGAFIAECAARYGERFTDSWINEMADLSVRVACNGQGRFVVGVETPACVASEHFWSARGEVVLDTASMDRLVGLFGAFLKG